MIRALAKIIASGPFFLVCTCMQVLTWDVPGGIAASESILVEVYDWERFGKHKYHCMPQILIKVSVRTLNTVSL